jgi:hypothetical protein
MKISSNPVGLSVLAAATVAFGLLGGGATAWAVTPAKPTCTITSPVDNTIVTTNSVTIKGKTHDSKLAVTNVYYDLDGAGWTAIGPGGTTNDFTNWSVVVSLTPGANTVKFYAVNSSNENSAATNLNIFYKVRMPLYVDASGPGTFGPYTNGQELVVGRHYTETAYPDAGCKFLYWTVYTNGAVMTNVSFTSLDFLMRTNIFIFATFEDVTKPTISITEPASKKDSNSVVTLSGTAYDSFGVQSVYYTINAGPTNYAVITTDRYTNWTAVLILSPGANDVRFYAQNIYGLVGSASITLHDLAAGFAPESLSGVILNLLGSNSSATAFFGMSTWAYVQGSNFNVGDYFFNQTGSNTAEFMHLETAPSATNEPGVASLTFTNSTSGTYSDSRGGSGTFTLGGATGVAPLSLDGTTLEGLATVGGAFTNHYTKGIFTADNLPGGVDGAGTFTYALYSPQMALLTATFTNTDLLGDANFVLLDFGGGGLGVVTAVPGKDTVTAPELTRNGFFYSEATSPAAAPSYDSGYFSALRPAATSAGPAPESLAGWTVSVVERHTRTNGTNTTVVTTTPLLGFGAATFGQIDANTNGTTYVGNYTYTRTGPRTGLMSMNPVAPPSDSNGIGLTLLNFTNAASFTFTNEKSHGTGAVLQESATVPVSLVGNTVTFKPATTNQGSEKVDTFGYDTFTSGTGTNTETKSYAFGQFGPRVALLQTADIPPTKTNYVTLWFSSANSGSYVVKEISTNTSRGSGTFTIK